MHLAAQYLAAAANSFLAHRPDDSQANLEFDLQNQRLNTRALDEKGTFLSLCYQSYSLGWHSPDQETKNLSLDKQSHKAVLEWLQKMSATIPGKKYSFEVTYEKPFDIGEDYVHQLTDIEALKKLAMLRARAQEIITGFLKKNKLKSEVKVWPHHFDTGAFAVLETDTGLSIGIGLAIPDTLSEDFYYYASAYLGEGAIDISQFGNLSNGRWVNDGFIGAILPANDLSVNDGILFFDEILRAVNH